MIYIGSKVYWAITAALQFLFHFSYTEFTELSSKKTCSSRFVSETKFFHETDVYISVSLPLIWYNHDLRDNFRTSELVPVLQVFSSKKTDRGVKKSCFRQVHASVVYEAQKLFFFCAENVVYEISLSSHKQLAGRTSSRFIDELREHVRNTNNGHEGFSTLYFSKRG